MKNREAKNKARGRWEVGRPLAGKKGKLPKRERHRGFLFGSFQGN